MSGAGGSTSGGGEVKGVVERVLDKRIVEGEVQACEPKRNLKCSQKIAELEKELNEREIKKSEEVTSHLEHGASEPACNNVSGLNQNLEENLVEDSEESGGSMRIRKTGNGKDLESGSSCSPTVTKELEALLNPVVLANLFRFISLKELAKCRLVCKTWEENSRLTWRSSSTLQLVYVSKQLTLLSTRLLEFLEFWDQECSLKPYRMFHLKDWKLFEPSVAKAKTPASLKGRIDRFWNVVGVSITSLTLTHCGFYGEIELRKILFQSCPNLETLVLDNCTTDTPINDLDTETSWELPNAMEYTEPFCGEQLNLKSLSVSQTCIRFRDDWPSGFPVTHLELLSHFPALKSLRISYPYRYCEVTEVTWDAIMWMNAIKVIRCHDERKLSKMQFQIDHMLWITNETLVQVQQYFNLLREFNAPLTAVTIDMGAQTVGNDMIRDTIVSHGRTLQKIITKEEKRRRSAVNIPNFGFPYGVELENLQTLDMCDRFCQNMEFIKYTPNLEELQIDQIGIRCSGYSVYSTVYYAQLTETHVVSNTFMYELENCQLVKLNKLELNCKLSDADLTCLSNWLPNIKELTMDANDAHFGVICKQWSKLVHLHVIDVGLTDAGIIGTGLELGIASGEGKGEEGLLQAPITLLNGLKCFKIRDGPFDGIKLTDASAVNGFMELRQLETLHFDTRDMWFGPATKKALCAKISNCKLHRRYRTVGCPCCERDVGTGKTLASCDCDW